MKRTFFSAIVLMATISPAMAATAPPVHPCLNLQNACLAAGYKKSHSSKNDGLWAGCLSILYNGGSVKGVSVSAADVSACQAERKRGKAWK